MKPMKFLNVVLLIFSLALLNSCQALKYKKVSAKDYPPDPKLRVKKNMEEGRGFRLFDNDKQKGGTFDFASANELWRASLDTIDFMPLASANYSGGIVITDWYTEDNVSKESIKISVRFLSNEIRADALDIKVFLRTCDQSKEPSVTKSKSDSTCAVNSIHIISLKCFNKYSKTVSPKSVNLMRFFCLGELFL